MEQKMRQADNTGKVVAFEKSEQQDVNVNFMEALSRHLLSPIPNAKPAGMTPPATYKLVIEKVKIMIAQKIALAQLSGLSRGDMDKEGILVQSIDELGNILNTNPNNVQKAYRKMISMDYLYSIPGKGYFISPNTRKGSESANGHIKKALMDLYASVIEFFIADVSLAFVQEMLTDICNGSTPDEVYCRHFERGANNPSMKKLASLMEEGIISEEEIKAFMRERGIGD